MNHISRLPVVNVETETIVGPSELQSIYSGEWLTGTASDAGGDILNSFAGDISFGY